MRRKKVLTDLSLLFFFLLYFITLIFVGMHSNQFLMNIVLASIALILTIVTYFTDITMGMILNLIYLFIQGGYTIYLTATGENTYQMPIYFWLVMTPLFSISIYLLTESTRQLKAENDRFSENTASARVNTENHLRTLLAFQEDNMVFATVAARYNIPYSLIGIQLNYWHEMEQILTKEQIKKVEELVIDSINQAKNEKGVVYVLDEEKLTFGILIYQDGEEVRQIIQKIKELFAAEAPNQFTEVALSIRAGYAAFDGATMKDSLEFMNEMIKELEYDV